MLRFIDYCTEKGGCAGLKRTSVEGTEEVVARLTALNIHTVPEGQYWAIAGENLLGQFLHFICIVGKNTLLGKHN